MIAMSDSIALRPHRRTAEFRRERQAGCASTDDLTVLPVMDVAAKGSTSPTSRVERYARAIFAELWSRDPDRFGPAYEHDREMCEVAAGAAIALADREAAEWVEEPSGPCDFRHRQRFKSGVRAAITWLQFRARKMNDPSAKALLHSAATNLGWDLAADKVPDGGLALAETGRGGAPSPASATLPGLDLALSIAIGASTRRIPASDGTTIVLPASVETVIAALTAARDRAMIDAVPETEEDRDGVL